MCWAMPPSNVVYFDSLIKSNMIQVIHMSFIPCTQNCKFQDEGLCTLAQAQTVGQAVPNDVCLNFTPRLSDQHSDRFTDVRNSDQI